MVKLLVRVPVRLSMRKVKLAADDAAVGRWALGKRWWRLNNTRELLDVKRHSRAT